MTIKSDINKILTSIGLGTLCILAGALPIILKAEPSQGVPVWIVYLACSVFVLAGVSVIATGCGLTWVSHIIGPLIILVFAIIATWIGFAPGERQCSSSISFPFLTKSKASGCGAFGVSAVLMWMLFFWVIYCTIAKKVHK